MSKLDDYYTLTPKERQQRAILRQEMSRETCSGCEHPYAEHKGKSDSRYLTACSRGECSCEGYVAPSEEPEPESPPLTDAERAELHILTGESPPTQPEGAGVSSQPASAEDCRSAGT